MASEDKTFKALQLDSLDLVQTPALLKQFEVSEVLSELDGGEIQYLAGCLKAYVLPARTVLFKEGDPASFMGMVLNGRLVVTKRNDEDTGKPLYAMTDGKVFGEMAMLDGEPRSATVMAAVETVIAVLSREEFERLCRERPIIGLKLMRRLGRLLSQRLRRASGLLVDYLP